MDGKELKVIAIGTFLVLALLIVGVFVTHTMAYMLRTSTTTSLNSITVAANNSLTNFNSSYPFVQTVTGCINASNGSILLNEANYTVVTGYDEGNGGFILKDSGVNFVGGTVNCSIVTYLATTTGTTVMNTAMLLFSTVAGFVILLILVLIVKSVIDMQKDRE